MPAGYVQFVLAGARCKHSSGSRPIRRSSYNTNQRQCAGEHGLLQVSGFEAMMTNRRRLTSVDGQRHTATPSRLQPGDRKPMPVSHKSTSSYRGSWIAGFFAKETCVGSGERTRGFESADSQPCPSHQHRAASRWSWGSGRGTDGVGRAEPAPKRQARGWAGRRAMAWHETLQNP